MPTTPRKSAPKKQQPKLKLTKEQLRDLSTQELKRVEGGKHLSMLEAFSRDAF
jgi:hypothetical protein